jgi:hypothetical protein
VAAGTAAIALVTGFLVLRDPASGGTSPGAATTVSGQATASGSGSSSGSPTTAATTGRSDAAATGAGGSPDTQAAPSATSRAGAADQPGSADGAVPAGFTLFKDPTGFSVAVPSGWKRSVRGSSTYYRDPAGSRMLQVDQTDRPKPDALRDWQDQESTAAGRFRGYQRVRLERIDYRGWNAADWEFTWRPSGGTLHVMNRNIRAGDHQAYALYWQVPAAEWQQRLSDFEVVARTFQPAS